MTLNSKQVLVSLNNEEIKDEQGTVITIGLVLSKVLVETQSVEVDKKLAYEMAKKFFASDGDVEVSDIELANIKTAVKAFDSLGTVIGGQILSILG